VEFMKGREGRNSRAARHRGQQAAGHAYFSTSMERGGEGCRVGRDITVASHGAQATDRARRIWY